MSKKLPKLEINPESLYPATDPRPRRSMRKCSQCRRLRKQCLPVERMWRWREQCDRCTMQYPEKTEDKGSGKDSFDIPRGRFRMAFRDQSLHCPIPAFRLHVQPCADLKSQAHSGPAWTEEQCSQALEKIPKYQISLARKFFCCLLAAERPLKMVEIMGILALDEGSDAMKIREYFGFRPLLLLRELERGVIAIDEKGEVQFANPGLRSFLNDAETKWRISQWEAEEFLAVVCLKYLARGTFLKDMRALSATNGLSSSKLLVVKYVMRHWVVHYMACKKQSNCVDGFLNAFHRDGHSPSYRSWRSTVMEDNDIECQNSLHRFEEARMWLRKRERLFEEINSSLEMGKKYVDASNEGVVALNFTRSPREAFLISHLILAAELAVIAIDPFRVSGFSSPKPGNPPELHGPPLLGSCKPVASARFSTCLEKHWRSHLQHIPMEHKIRLTNHPKTSSTLDSVRCWPHFRRRVQIKRHSSLRRHLRREGCNSNLPYSPPGRAGYRRFVNRQLRKRAAEPERCGRPVSAPANETKAHHLPFANRAETKAHQSPLLVRPTDF